jgi:hypothetical protein
MWGRENTPKFWTLGVKAVDKKDADGEKDENNNSPTLVRDIKVTRGSRAESHDCPLT